MVVKLCFFFNRKKHEVSFLLENGGVYAAAALIFAATGDQQVGNFKLYFFSVLWLINIYQNYNVFQKHILAFFAEYS